MKNLKRMVFNIFYALWPSEATSWLNKKLETARMEEEAYITESFTHVKPGSDMGAPTSGKTGLSTPLSISMSIGPNVEAPHG